MNGLRLKIYHARLMMVVKDEELQEGSMPVEDASFFDAEGVQALFVAADHE